MSVWVLLDLPLFVAPLTTSSRRVQALWPSFLPQGQAKPHRMSIIMLNQPTKWTVNGINMGSLYCCFVRKKSHMFYSVMWLALWLPVLCLSNHEMLFCLQRSVEANFTSKVCQMDVWRGREGPKPQVSKSRTPFQYLNVVDKPRNRTTR